MNWYVPRWLPIDNRLDAMRGWWRLAPYLRGLIPCWNYTRVFPELTAAQLREWAILDTFNSLAPVYDAPQRLETVQQWFAFGGLVNFSVRYGGNGIVGTGTEGVLYEHDVS